MNDFMEKFQELAPVRISNWPEVSDDFFIRRKTPYKLDLETKDRKPFCIPQIGDKVKIKSLDWYNKWKDIDGSISIEGVPFEFNVFMAEFCGKESTVNTILVTPEGSWFKLSGIPIWYFAPEFFEVVYPAGKRSHENELVLHQDQIDVLKIVLQTKGPAVKGITLTDHPFLTPAVVKETKLKQIRTTHLIELKKI